MVTDCAQPTDPHTPPMCVRSSAAGATRVVLVVSLLLLTLCLPAHAHGAAAGVAASTGKDGAWPWPLSGEVVTPYKNGSDRYAAGQHRGLDIAAPAGAPVVAIVDGRISFSGRLPDGGQTVTLTSADGRWLISHLHLSSRARQRGQRVRAGQLLGRVGLTGRRSTGAAHLHLSVREAATRNYVDPLTLLGPRVVAKLKRPQPARATARPKITALERPPRAQNIRAQATNDNASARWHAQPRRAAARQSTQTRSAGASSRTGHAQAGISRVAPPPARTAAQAGRPAESARPASPVADGGAAATTAAAAAPATAAERAQAPSGASPRRRGLLLAVAVVCLVALLMRRETRSTPGARPPAEEAARDQEPDETQTLNPTTAEVIPLRHSS